VKLLKTIERRYGRLAVPRLTLYLVAGQVAVYLLVLAHVWAIEQLTLIPERVLAGEWWRLATFVFVTPITNAVYAFFGWYLFFLMGSALENRWGALRFNLFLLTGYAATVAAAFLTPGATASPAFLGGSVFLAFAFLYPDFVIHLFFILPVRIKWLALIAWLGYGATLTLGSWSSRALALAAVGNFLLFFARDIVALMRLTRRHMARQTRDLAPRREPRHRCVVCGITDVTAPDTDFRYCTQCEPAACFCPDHIRNHEHVGKGSPEQSG